MSRINSNGLTLARWCDAAGLPPSLATLTAWEAGEDPAEHRAVDGPSPNYAELEVADVIELLDDAVRQELDGEVAPPAYEIGRCAVGCTGFEIEFCGARRFQVSVRRTR